MESLVKEIIIESKNDIYSVFLKNMNNYLYNIQKHKVENLETYKELLDSIRTNKSLWPSNVWVHNKSLDKLQSRMDLIKKQLDKLKSKNGTRNKKLRNEFTILKGLYYVQKFQSFSFINTIFGKLSNATCPQFAEKDILHDEMIKFYFIGKKFMEELGKVRKAEMELEKQKDLTEETDEK